jgi:hypothetical protein
LAWHCAKNIKNKVEGKRPVRKDFISLMQKEHWFTYTMNFEGKNSMMLDIYPAENRPDRDKYIVAMFSGDAATLKELHRTKFTLRTDIDKYGTDYFFSKENPANH